MPRWPRGSSAAPDLGALRRQPRPDTQGPPGKASLARSSQGSLPSISSWNGRARHSLPRTVHLPPTQPPSTSGGRVKLGGRSPRSIPSPRTWAAPVSRQLLRSRRDWGTVAGTSPVSQILTAIPAIGPAFTSSSLGGDTEARISRGTHQGSGSSAVAPGAKICALKPRSPEPSLVGTQGTLKPPGREGRVVTREMGQTESFPTRRGQPTCGAESHPRRAGVWIRFHWGTGSPQTAWLTPLRNMTLHHR